MPPVSVKELIRFTPPQFEDKENPPVFLIKSPTLRDKIALESCLAVEGVRYPSNSEYVAAMKDGVRVNVIEEEQQMLLAYIDEFESLTDEGNPVDQDLSERIEKIARTLRQFHRPLAQIDADRGRFLAMSMLIRAEMFLVSIEGDDNTIKIEKRLGRMTDACQEAIETKYGTGVLFAIGAKTLELTMPTEPEVKNSESLEPSPADPEISMEAHKLPMVRRGKSSANGTHETHV
jgi:hypothetical protein